MSSIFKLSNQNQVVWQFSLKFVAKTFDPFFKTFLTNRGKNEDKLEKKWENVFDFLILLIKIGIMW